MDIVNYHNLKIDSNKKNLLFVQKYLDQDKIYNHLTGWSTVVQDKLKENYNIFYFVLDLKSTTEKYIKDNNIENVISINSESLSKLLKSDIFRNKSHKERKEYYFEHIKSLLDYTFEGIYLIRDSLFWITHKNSVPKKYREEYGVTPNRDFYDYLDDEDSKSVEGIEKVMDGIIQNIERETNILAFSRKDQGLLVWTLLFMHENNLFKKVSIFMIDTNSSYPILYRLFGEKANTFYFRDDVRGSRKFKYFPFAEIQHFLYDKKFTEKSLFPVKKDKNFIFYGTIFLEDGDLRRVKSWERFLRDLDDKKSSYYIPLANRVATEKKPTIKKNNIQVVKQSKHPRIKKAYKEVSESKYHKGHFLPKEAIKILKEYKYTLITHPITSKQSLNYRVYLAIEHGVLPFVAEDYDPDGIQIPLNIQEKVRVSDHNDIQEKINYFNKNEKERKQLIEDLKAHYKYKEFLNGNIDYEKLLELK